MERKLLGIDVVRIDGDTQSRDEINQSLINDYAEDMDRGDVFPAILVFFDGVSYWLADGFHRYFAVKKLGLGSISADVRQGTKRDAWLYSLEANGRHGERRTAADKRKSVLRALDDFELSTWSDVEIARKCVVSDRFVSKMRGDSGPAVRKFKKADGTIGEKAVRQKEKWQPPEMVPMPKAPENMQSADVDHEHMEMVTELMADNERLADRLAVAAMEATEEEKALASETIESLREELRILKIELAAVKQSRDQFQSECAQLKKQCASYVKKLKLQA